MIDWAVNGRKYILFPSCCFLLTEYVASSSELLSSLWEVASRLVLRALISFTLVDASLAWGKFTTPESPSYHRWLKTFLQSWFPGYDYSPLSSRARPSQHSWTCHLIAAVHAGHWCLGRKLGRFWVLHRIWSSRFKAMACQFGCSDHSRWLVGNVDYVFPREPESKSIQEP